MRSLYHSVLGFNIVKLGIGFFWDSGIKEQPTIVEEYSSKKRVREEDDIIKENAKRIVTHLNRAKAILDYKTEDEIPDNYYEKMKEDTKAELNSIMNILLAEPKVETEEVKRKKLSEIENSPIRRVTEYRQGDEKPVGPKG
jgi:hypothetical protein